MSAGFEEMAKKRPNYRRTFLTCIIASELVHEDSPYDVLKNKYKCYDHGIGKMIKSQSSEIDLNYLICECYGEKKIVISFGPTKSMKDFFLNFQLDSDIEGLEGKFHSALYQRAKRIPLKFLVDKILNDNYDIIFTGHSLGASVAAIVALRLITNKEIRKYLK